MTKLELKRRAQGMILMHGQVAWNHVVEDDPDKEQLEKYLDQEFRRIEKLFGYEPGSWGRGV